MSLLPSPIPHPLSFLDAPAWARSFLEWAVGMEWPDGDEAAMRALADEWHAAARQLPPLLDEADVVVLQAVAAFGGPEGRTAAAMLALWHRIGQGPQAALAGVVEVLGLFGEAVDAGANQIEATKIEFYIELIILLIELAVMVATAAITFGGSMAAAGPAVMVTRFAISQLLKKAAKELVENAVKKGIKGRLEDLVKDKIEDRVRSRLARFALDTAGDGLGEGLQEAATSAGTQAYQVSEGNRRGVGVGDVATSFGLGTLGGSVANITSIGGLRSTSLTGRLGESVLRGAGGEILAEVSVAVVTGQGLSVQDLGMAATSSAADTTIGNTQHQLKAELGELNALMVAPEGSLGEASSAQGLSRYDTGVQTAGDTAAYAGSAVVVSVAGDATTVADSSGAASASMTASDLGGPVDIGVITGTAVGGQEAMSADAAGGGPSAEAVGSSFSSVADVVPEPETTAMTADASIAPSASLSAAAAVAAAPEVGPAAGSPSTLPITASVASSGVSTPTAAASPGPGLTAPTVPAGSMSAPTGATAAAGPAAGPSPGHPVRGAVPAPATSALAQEAGRVEAARPADPAGAGRSVPPPEHDPEVWSVPGHGRSAEGGPRDPAGTGDSSTGLPLAHPAIPQRAGRQPSTSDGPPTSSIRPLLVEDEAERLAYAEAVLVGVRQRVEAELNRLVDTLIEEGRARQDDLMTRMEAQPDDQVRRVLDDLYEAEMRRVRLLRGEGRFALSRADAREVCDRVFEAARQEVMGGRFRTVDGGLNFADRVSLATMRDVPPPVEASRRYGQRGGYIPPLALHQQDLELAVPLDESGRPVRFPDLFGRWPELANDGGPAADPARAINCVDVVLSVVDTWLHGRPRVAAPRTVDEVSLDAELRPLGGEPGGAARIEQATGGRFQTVPPTPDGVARLEDALRQAGHGACAVLIQEFSNGQAHATTVHNQFGQMVYVDAQMSDYPVRTLPPPGAVRMDALVLDPDAKPVDLRTPPGDWSMASIPTDSRMLRDITPAEHRALGIGSATLVDLGYLSLSQVPDAESDSLAEALPRTTMLHPEQLRYTQRGIPPVRVIELANGHTAGQGAQTGPGRKRRVVTTVRMETDLRLYGWQDGPLHAVRWGDGSFAAIDNERLRAARRAGLDQVPVAVHQPSDPLGDWPHTLAAMNAVRPLSVDIRRLPDGQLTANGDTGDIVYPRGSLPRTWGELAMFRAAGQDSLLHSGLFGTDEEPVLLPLSHKPEATPEIPSEIREALGRLRRAAVATADAVQADLQALGYPLHGTEHRVKPGEPLERKFVDEGEGFDHDLRRFSVDYANDVLRFSVVLPDGDEFVPALDNALDALRARGYEVVAEKNFWLPGNRFYGFHTTLRTPDGQLFEVQFPTPTSVRAGNLTDELCETLRREDEHPARRVHALLQMLAINRRLGLPGMIPPGLTERTPPSQDGLLKWIKKDDHAWADYLAWLDYHDKSFAEMAAEFGLAGDDLPVTKHLSEADDAVLRALQSRQRLGEGRAGGGHDDGLRPLRRPGDDNLHLPRPDLEPLAESLEIRSEAGRKDQEQQHLPGSGQAGVPGGGRGDDSGDHERRTPAERGPDHVDLSLEGQTTAVAPGSRPQLSWDDVATLLPADDRGRQVTPEQCEFLGITPDQVARWAARETVLGLTPEQYHDLRDGLSIALASAGVDPATVDTRMIGSSARFFSGRHKPFPSREEVEAEAPGVLHRFDEWPGAHLTRRPFDSMYQLGCDAEPSDFDLHLSSDAIVERAERVRALFFPGRDLFHDKYKFVDKAVMELAFPDLYQWAQLESLKLGRSVNPAAFGSSGPPDLSGPDGTSISSHFRDDDWMVTLPQHEPDPATPSTSGLVHMVPFSLHMTPVRLHALRSALGLDTRGRLSDDWDMKHGETHLTVDGRPVRLQLWRTTQPDQWQFLISSRHPDSDLTPVLDSVTSALTSVSESGAGVSLATPPPDPEGRA